MIHNPEFTTGLWDGMEDGASMDCSPKVSITQVGTAEGQFISVPGNYYNGDIYIECNVERYYHSGCFDPQKKGWHKADDYKKIVKYIVRDIAVVNGDIERTTCATFKDEDLEFAKSRVNAFFSSNEVSSSFWVIVKGEYSSAISEYRLESCGAGVTYEVPIIYDIVDFMSGFGVIKQIPKFLNVSRIIRGFGLKFSQNTIVNESGEVLAELSGCVLKNIKFADNEVKLVGSIDEIVDYEVNGVVKTGKLEVVDVGGKKALRISGGVDDIANLINRWDNLTASEVSSLFKKLSKTEIIGSKAVRTQEEILHEFETLWETQKAARLDLTVSPYSFTDEISDYSLTKEALFVRVHNEANPNRPWLIAIEDFHKFTSKDDMINRLALPIIDKTTGNVIKPTELSLVKLPIGTKVRKSVARPQDWPGQGHQLGGSIQYEIRDNQAIPKSWFQSIDKLDNILK